MVSQADSVHEDHAAPRFRHLFHSVLEYLGMVTSMLAGMVVLGWMRAGVVPGPVLRPDLEAMIMATEMMVGMAVWMVARRHTWRGIAVMSAVMYVPFLLLTPLFWVGAISGEVLGSGGHVLMLLAMALAMPLTHRTGRRHAQAQAQAQMTAPQSADADQPRDAVGDQAISPVRAPVPTCDPPSIEQVPTPGSRSRPHLSPSKELP